MQLTDEQKAEIEQQIAQYEQRRDALVSEANVAQGAALALKSLLAPQPALDQGRDDKQQ